MIPFEKLSDEDKFQMVIINGTFITSIDYYNSVAKLYSLSDKFIEIQFDRSMERVESINVLANDNLNRYINRIEIGDAFIPNV